MKTRFLQLWIAFFWITACALIRAEPAISINSINVGEGAGTAEFTVTLSEPGPLDENVSVSWSTRDGTALSPGDYGGASGFIVFPVGATSMPLSIPLNDDTVGEREEYFEVRLEVSSLGSSIAVPVGTATIQENDVTPLEWDPGSAHAGTEAYTPLVAAGDHVFKIASRAPARGGWRTGLKVTSGEAHLHMAAGYIPTAQNFQFSSALSGSDGWVLSSEQFSEGTEYYITVQALPGAEWSLFSGDIFVRDLGSLPYADANGNARYDIGEEALPGGAGPLEVGPEGALFFQSAAPPGTPAWSLWLKGLPRSLAVRKARPPFQESPALYDRRQTGRMLLVPPYLGSGSDAYFFSVEGVRGETVDLDSRIQTVRDIPFPAILAAESVTGSPYRVFRTTVPIDQLGWDVSTTALSGNPNVAVRRGEPPAEFENDGFSEAPGAATDSVTMVPDFLTNGTWYITVWGGEPYQFTLRSANPEVTPIDFTDTETNTAQASRAGWRYYGLTDIQQQLGKPGWELLLSDQIPGTQIAVRRNKLPGRWQYRTGGSESTGDTSAQHVDESGSGGFLQRPNHQADIWYVGVFLPQEALGAFTLNTRAIAPAMRGFDGSSSPVTGLRPGEWRFTRVEVPADAAGWDVRLKEVTAGSPRLVVRRDLLPQTVATVNSAGGQWNYPESSESWPSGYAWAGSLDWTGRNNGTGETENHLARRIVAASGRPLEAGTYYVGVLNSELPGGTSASYSLESRGFGVGRALAITNLPFAAGPGVSINNLGPREAAHFRVTVPANTPSWEFSLTPSAGEMMLAARRGAVPDFGLTGDLQAFGNVDSREIRVQKPGPERYVLLPASGMEFLTPGDYYLAAVGEGVSPPNDSTTGAGVSSGVLMSHGPLTVTDLGAASEAGLTSAVSLASGQIKAHTFTVPAGAASVEVRLGNRVGNPWMSLWRGNGLPRPGFNAAYGSGGGQADDQYAQDDDLITLTNPPAGLYSLTLSAAPATNSEGLDGNYPAAAADLSVRVIPPTPLTFDGGVVPVTGQDVTAWRYFKVTIPAGIDGWDVRLRDVTAGSPQLVVARDLPPPFVGTYTDTGAFWSGPEVSESWPSGFSWMGAMDWTGRRSEPGGGRQHGSWRVVAAAGRPLEPGTYYVGVYNAVSPFTEPVSYALESRGIGAGQAIPVTPLPRSGAPGSAVNGLAARDAAYFRVTVPADTRSWEFTLTPSAGDLMLAARRGAIPDLGAPGDLQAPGGFESREVRIQKPGPERYVLLPLNGAEFLVPGDYYLAVVSEGVDPLPGGVIGRGTASGVLTSLGDLAVTDLGTASGASLTQTVSLAGGRTKAYTFTVPAGAASLEVRLDNRTGNPWMSLREGGGTPAPPFQSFYGSGGGQTGGGYTLDDNLLTLTNPAPGVYSIAVSAISADGSPGPDANIPDASATLVVKAGPPAPLAFSGGTAGVVDQEVTSWRYFKVTVPAGVAGWDIRLKNVAAGSPQLVVRRDLLPDTVASSAGVGGWRPETSSSWPSGWAWAGGVDWTGRNLERGGGEYGLRRVAAAMGRPLEAGTYYVGVYASGFPVNAPAAYTLESRSVGAGADVPVTPLAFAGGSAAVNSLEPREAAHFRVTVPENVPGWEFSLTPSAGEMMLAVRRGGIPDFGIAGELQSFSDSGSRQVRIQKPGPESYLLLPPPGEASLVAGDYHIAVVSEGQNPPNAATPGVGPSSGTLISHGPPVIADLGAITEAGVTRNVSLAGGRIQAYRFQAPAGTQNLEVRLDNREGNPWMSLLPGVRVASPASATFYGSSGGENGESYLQDESLIALSNPVAGLYNLVLSAALAADSSPGPTGNYPAAQATLVVRQKPHSPLNFAESMNGNGRSHTDTRQLVDAEKAYYEIAVPAAVDGVPVTGWVLRTVLEQGDTSLRIFRNPADSAAGIAADVNTVVVAPPFLTPGETWYVEVTAVGLTRYTLTSSPVTPARPAWAMPAGHNATFGDTGNAADGSPLPGDRGIDIGQDDWHFYAVEVPTDNSGLLRTELRAINGNPDLYIREDGVPSTDHDSNGGAGGGDPLYHRSLTATATEYGNWTLWDGRTEKRLRSGRWYLGVKAAGGSNARYRLIVSTGQVTDLALAGGAAADQILAGRDWRYYRFTVPEDAPDFWSLTFQQTSGDVTMWLRDTSPPGAWRDGLSGVLSWATDDKNHGPYEIGGHSTPGVHTLTTPPLQPGSVYYAGFRAVNDAAFSVSSAVSGGTLGSVPAVDFRGAGFNATVPPGGSLLYRVTVPPDATAWKQSTIQTVATVLRIESGAPPVIGGNAHYSSPAGATETFLDVPLTQWPWVPGAVYYLRVTNTGPEPAPFALAFNNTGADTNNNGLGDAWETQYFGAGNPQPAAADFDGDGIVNLLEFAFGMNPARGLVENMGSGGTAPGLPFTDAVNTGSGPRLRVEFLRRRDAPWLTYRPVFSGALSGASWAESEFPPAVTPADAQWERVMVEDSAPIPSGGRRFSRIEVESGP